MENKINIRNLVINMLAETLTDGKFSHIVLNETLSGFNIQQNEKAFLNRLYMGVLERLVYLDFILDKYSKTPVKKMKPVIRNILRTALYQILFMDSVPDRAAIDEAVKITKKRGFMNLSGFVNGILRAIERDKEKETEAGSNAGKLFGGPDLPVYIRYSVPEWLYSLLVSQYGPESTVQFFEAISERKNGTIVRFNLSKAGREEIIRILEEDQCHVEPLFDQKDMHEDYYTPNAYVISGFESLTNLKAFKQGLIIMQDAASMKVSETAAFYGKTGLAVDICAAPGGKSLYLAELMPETAIISRDLTEHKVELIKENIKRLGITNITPQVFDASVSDKVLIEKADIVIADVPCSGLGVIGHKPDLISRIKKEDLDQLSALQKKILDTVCLYVKKGGILVYSTCTINKKENSENTDYFLNKHSEFEKVYEKQFLPGEDKCDGFYIAVFKKI